MVMRVFGAAAFVLLAAIPVRAGDADRALGDRNLLLINLQTTW